MSSENWKLNLVVELGVAPWTLLTHPILLLLLPLTHPIRLIHLTLNHLMIQKEGIIRSEE
ncbi:ORF1170 [White spot syndrome virus]|uniref:ORF1170 n=1 Tax=White spot syndrome virus TaxID=342409 RepID=A0A2D3I765_9VIRU|nr:ORF1170 [White spot syndrome virus]